MKTIVPSFHYVKCKDLKEALEQLVECTGELSILAGGTDLIVKMIDRKRSGKIILDISDISELARIEQSGDTILIGASVKLHALEISDVIREKLPALAMAASEIGSPQIRNQATIGGNLVNASPAADTVSALMLYDADVIIVGAEGEKSVPVSSFITANNKTTLGKKEIVKAIRITLNKETSNSCFFKLGQRKASRLSVVNVAVMLVEEKNICRGIRISLGAVAPTVIRAGKAEEFLSGKELTEANINEAGRIASGETNPISDVRASKEYRIEMSRVMVIKCIRTLLDR